MKRGDIYLVSLDPTQGHEQQGTRPVLIVSPDRFNQVMRVPIVVPITSGGRFARNAGFSVSLTNAGTRTTGIVRCDQPQMSINLAAVDSETASLKGNVELLLQKALQATASLSQPQFDHSLKAVSTQLGIARSVRVKLEPQTEKDLRLKLVESEQQNNPLLWMAKGSFLATESAKPLLHIVDVKTLPPCLGGRTAETVFNGTFDFDFRCQIVLDNFHLLAHVTLYNAVIVYRGGPVNVQNVTLHNCYFFFEIQTVPQPSGQRYMDYLLASTSLKKVVIRG